MTRNICIATMDENGFIVSTLLCLDLTEDEVERVRELGDSNDYDCVLDAVSSLHDAMIRLCDDAQRRSRAEVAA